MTNRSCLVLEGGAMRGLFTAGVIDVLMENGIEFDCTVGVSAGAAFGCNVKSKQIGRVIRYNKRFCKDKRYCSIHSLLTTGDLYGAQFCYHTLPNELDVMDVETYNNNPSRFVAVCTDVETGKPVYHDCEVLDETALEYVRASASMPVASRVVEINGEKLLDGGISDSIPVKWAEREGYTKQVVVLTQPKSYRKKPQSALGILKLLLRKYPKVIECLEKRHIQYNETLDYITELEKQGKIVVIRPEASLQIGKMEKDPAVLEDVYHQGRAVCLAQLSQIQSYMK